MDTIEVTTLIDITGTKVTRLSQGSQLQLDQQRNFTTLLQCLEIRSIISYDSLPSAKEKQDLRDQGFGSQYKGKHTVWTFRFSTDRSSVYLDNDGNDLGNLVEDLHEVPVIKNLLETVNIDKSIFDCKDPIYKNTIVKIV